MSVTFAFILDLPQGRCVGVALPREEECDACSAALLPAEHTLLASLPPPRRPSFLAGRVALRRALADLGLDTTFPLLPDARGAPTLPATALGSISHKTRVAVALAARRTSPDEAIGVDLEEIRPLRADLARRILTPAERDELADTTDPAARDRFVLERFSLKEAFFKAANLTFGPTISFQAVTVGATSATPIIAAPLLASRGWHARAWLGSPAPGLVLSAIWIGQRVFPPPSTS